MKILYILKTNTGAAWAYRIVKWIVENKNVDFTVVMPNDKEGYAKKYKELGVKVIGLDVSLPVKKIWKIFSIRKSIKALIAEEKPDLIHMHFVTNVLMMRLAVRNVAIPRLFQVPGPLHLESKLFKFAELVLKNKYDYWAPSCKKTEEIYKKSGIPEERLFLCYYGDDVKSISDFNTDLRLRKQYNIPSDSPIVATVSYFYKPKYHMLQFRGLKGHEDFIDAFSIVLKKYPEATGVVIGGPWGNSEKYMNKVIAYAQKKCGDKIIFTGYRNDVFNIYNEINVTVHPSHSENLGGAFESLALGVPTVSTDIGGFPDIVIDGKTGYTAPKKDPQKLALAIQKMLDDPENAVKMAKEGQKHVYNLCDINKTANDVYKAYNEILSKNSK